MSAQDFVRIEHRDAYLWMTLDRAEKANALAVAMMEAATRALKAAQEDESVRGVLITGAGDRVFCAGVDVREQPVDGDMPAHRRRRAGRLAELLDTVIDMPKPIVAVLNGTASGGGAMLALLADARVAAESASLALPEIDLGLSTFTGAAIAECIGGLALAVDLVQSGRRMPAHEALARGLITAVAAPPELEQAATRVADVLAKKDSRAFAANKRWLNRRVKSALAEARQEHERHREQRA
jgi:enoyl-CoA hydratase/carnithine racemase